MRGRGKADGKVTWKANFGAAVGEPEGGSEMMRSKARWLLVGVACVGFWPAVTFAQGTASAQWTDDARRCAQETRPELVLDYCSRAIQSGQLSAANLAIIFQVRGAHYTGKGEYDRAIQDFSEAIRLNPNDARAFYNRGNTYGDMGEHDRAIEDFSQAIRLNPQYAKAFYNRGVTHAYKRAYDRAIQDFAQAVQLNPNDDKALYNLGKAYADKGDYDRAIEAYGRAIRVNPSLAAAFYNRGLAYAHKGDSDRAIQDFDHAIRLNPNDASAFYNLGRACLDKGDYDGAIRANDQAIRLDPKKAEAFNNRGAAYQAKGEYDRALKDFDQAIRLDPNSAEPFYGRGLVQFTQGQFAAAVPELAKAVELDPVNEYRAIWLYLARARAGQSGRESLASSASRFNLEHWPGPVVSMYLGRIPPDAVLQGAIDPDPNKQRVRKCEAHFFGGEYLLVQGLRDEAVRMFQAAVASCGLGAPEYHSAKAELRRMGN